MSMYKVSEQVQEEMWNGLRAIVREKFGAVCLEQWINEWVSGWKKKRRDDRKFNQSPD